MTEKIKRTSCDLCSKEIILNPGEDLSLYNWNTVFHNGKTYDLCPEHYKVYSEIVSGYDEKLNKFFNE